MREEWFINLEWQYIAYSLLNNSNSKGIVIFCHWLWSSQNSKTFDILAEWLLSYNISSIKFDFFWHGKSSGYFESLDPYQSLYALEKVFDFVKELWFKQIGLVWTSYGGLIASAFSIKHSVDFLLLKSPVSDYYQKEKMLYWIEYIENWKKQGYCIKNIWQEKKLFYSFLENISKKDFLVSEFWYNIKCPVCVIHGWSDQMVPLEQSINFIKNIADVRLIIIQRSRKFTNKSLIRNLRMKTYITLNCFKH